MISPSNVQSLGSKTRGGPAAPGIADSPLLRAKTSIGIKEAAARLFRGRIIEGSCRSPFRTDHTPSFSVYADGKRWHDFGTDEGGDVVDFVAKAKGCTTSEAARILIAWDREDGSHTDKTAAVSAPAQPMLPVNSQPRALLRAMDGAVLDAWNEGVEYLGCHPDILTKLDERRGWPVGQAEALFQYGLLSSPLQYGRRGLAFVVQAPYKPEASFVRLIDVGYHLRLKPRRPGDRTLWMYFPSASKGGVGGIPTLPFVLGSGYIGQAETIIVTEGQWDCITFASAAGWLVSDSAWPTTAVAFGVRGTSGWRPLLDWWSDLWPATARFVIFRDADTAGARWTSPGNFVEALQERGHAVRVVCSRNEAAKDFNDVHRASPVSREEILRLISPHSQT